MDELKRQKQRVKSTGVAVVLVGIVLALHTSLVTAAERVASSAFKNVDEVVGWVKAKGICKPQSDPTRFNCSVDIEMPRVTSEGERVSPNDEIRGRLTVIQAGPFRTLRLSIVRERRITITDKDALRVVKVSGLTFESNGKAVEVYTNLRLTNAKGEELFFVTIPLPHPGEDTQVGTEDMYLIREAFGIGWNYYR